MLVDRGSTNHCVNAGGDIRVRGEPEPGRPWRAGIVHPLVPGKLTVVVAGRDLAVATSGTSERGLHVINPLTGRPADALASVTVVGPDLTVTDALATAAVAMGLDAPRWLETLPDHDAYVIDGGGHVWWTAGFATYAPALATIPRPELAVSRDGGADESIDENLTSSCLLLGQQCAITDTDDDTVNEASLFSETSGTSTDHLRRAIQPAVWVGAHARGRCRRDERACTAESSRPEGAPTLMGAHDPKPARNTVALRCDAHLEATAGHVTVSGRQRGTGRR